MARQRMEEGLTVTYPRMTVPEPYAYRVRAELRKIPTWKLKEAYQALGAGRATGVEVVEANRAHALSAIREILWERGALSGQGAEDVIGDRVITTLLTRTINDITVDQMNRIVRRLSRMPRAERGIPKRVADVIADELGPQKALQYVDKALAAGQISAREYDEMRAALLLPMPRAEIPAPTIRRMAGELLQTQQRMREDFKKLTGQGQQAFRKPLQAIDEDVKRIRKAWGL